MAGPILSAALEAMARQFEEGRRSEAGGSVNHPRHYNQHPSGVECIDIVEHMPFNVGSAMKYLWRAGLKGDSIQNQIEDLEKAKWYVDREIERIRRFEMHKDTMIQNAE